MTQENKELLIKDISARVPYNLQVEVKGKNTFINTLYSIDIEGNCEINDDLYSINKIKPCLFPLSSITEKQKEEYEELIENNYSIDANGNVFTLQDFYNKNHIDYRGLIKKRLAINATNTNIYINHPLRGDY